MFHARSLPAGPSSLVVAALCLTAPSARAETGAAPLAIEVGADLPFAEAELKRLVDLRVAKDLVKACPVARIEAAEAGVVVVACPDRRSEVWIGTRTPQDAARIVAVVLADLVTSAPAAPRPAGSAAPDPVASVVRASPSPPQPAGTPRLSLWLAPGVGVGVSGSGATFELRAGGAWALSPRVRALLEGGLARASTTEAKTNIGVTMDMVPLRAGVGVLLGPIELRAGGVGRVFHARAGSTDTGVRMGGWIAAAWTVGGQSPGRSVLPFVSLGLDAYLERFEIRIEERPLLTAGALAPWAALGVVWRGVRR